MKSLKEKIEVMQAALDGKEIESFTSPSIGWITLKNPEFDNWAFIDYRIKQEPMTGYVTVYNESPSLMFKTLEQAENNRISDVVKIIKVREVTE